MNPYEFVNILREVINDITMGGVMPVAKISDSYYSNPDKKVSLPFLKLFPDGVLMPGHARQALYNLTILLQSNTLPLQSPFFSQWTKYGIRLYDGNRWSGFIPIITTNSKIGINISKILYSNIRDIFKQYDKLSQSK
jgi:hypothetical protein